MTEATGTLLEDTIDSNNIGLDAAPIRVNGHKGLAPLFDGALSGQLSRIFHLDELAMGMWLKPVDNSEEKPVGGLWMSDGSAGDDEWRVVVDADMKVRFDAMIGGVLKSALSSDALSDTALSFVGVQYDGADLKVFVNNVEKASTAAAGAIDDANIAGLLASDLSGNFFAGVISKVRIWDRALDASEWTSVYND